MTNRKLLLEVEENAKTLVRKYNKNKRTGFTKSDDGE